MEHPCHVGKYHNIYLVLACVGQGELGMKRAAKMTKAQIIELRRLYATGRHTQTLLGEHFGIDQTTVNRIVRYRSWKHVLKEEE